MRIILSGPALSALSVLCVWSLPAVATPGQVAVPATPGEVVAGAPGADWVRIAPEDLVVMDLAAHAGGRARRVVIQLMPAPFSQGWIDNIRKLVAARWFDGIAVVRVQDNYVVQWGDPEGETPGKARALPQGLRTMTAADYVAPIAAVPGGGAGTPGANGPGAKTAPPFTILSWGNDPYLTSPGEEDWASRTAVAGFSRGWPVAMLPENPRGDGRDAATDIAGRTEATAWPLHCYGMVGVGRNVAPDAGTGAELYAVIGHAPRQLDRNVALVGRVVAGIEHLSSLARGTGEMGFYRTPAEHTPIVSVRMGNAVAGLPGYEYLSTESASFAAYIDRRANRKDDFFTQPAGGVDVCNVPVPVREVAR